MGLRPLPSIGAGSSRRNGFDVARIKARNPTPIMPWTAITRARRVGGRLAPKPATAPPNSARINTHNTMDPS